MNLESYWSQGMTWEAYRKLVDDLWAQGKTTGPDQSEKMLEYAKLNLARMQRLEKTTELQPEAVATLEQVKGSPRFLVITEGWCGESAQCGPPVEKLIGHRGWESRYLLRDEHPELMDQFLTNGGRSIPVVIMLDAAGNTDGEKWGPRPAEIQQLRLQWVAEGLPYAEVSQRVHTWFAKDKTVSTQLEFARWVKQQAAVEAEISL